MEKIKGNYNRCPGGQKEKGKKQHGGHFLPGEKMKN